jgi:hypothetical protein
MGTVDQATLWVKSTCPRPQSCYCWISLFNLVLRVTFDQAGAFVVLVSALLLLLHYKVAKGFPLQDRAKPFSHHFRQTQSIDNALRKAISNSHGGHFRVHLFGSYIAVTSTLSDSFPAPSLHWLVEHESSSRLWIVIWSTSSAYCTRSCEAWYYYQQMAFLIC